MLSNSNIRGESSLSSPLNSYIPKIELLKDLESFGPAPGRLQLQPAPSTSSPVSSTSTVVVPSNQVEAMNDPKSNLLVHGYVHGHIHKHKDHTHIHGHIHNHDHNNSNRVAQNNFNELDSCKELEAASFCDGIVCDELDDCFFLDCHDEDESSSTKHEHSNIDFIPDMSCFDPSCSINHHENNLCDFQTAKRPLFESLINNVHNETEEKRQLKKLKSDKIMELHFPHICHTPLQQQQQQTQQTQQLQQQLGSLELNLISLQSSSPLLTSNLFKLPISSRASEYSANHLPAHHIHNSCFHTKIQHEEDIKTISDYEFYVQFNNFEKSLSNSVSNFKSNGGNSSEIDPPLFQCQWDNCFNQINDDTFIQHLLLTHINDDTSFRNTQSQQHFQQQQQEQEQEQQDIQEKSKFHCEWNNCDYSIDTLDSLLEHVTTHKQNFFMPGSNLFPTPTPVFPTPTSASPPSGPSENLVNITSLKISPRELPEAIDESYTCKWQVGTDEATGSPIPCGKCHGLSAELQDHLIEHIGQGKSIYHCEWVGCERHKGKAFVQKQKLLRHIHIHTGHKPCKCEICGAKFAVESMLKQHLRIHTGEKPFQCSICGKQFTTSSSLSIHNRVHTGEKPLICKWPGCGKRFSESSNLTKHMKIHMKSFQCEVCGKEFEKKPEYTKHLKLHG